MNTTLIGLMLMIMNTLGLNNVPVVEYDSVTNNVGNGLAYEYEITSIEDNEIHGIALNRVSEDNQGIFLYKDELEFNVNVGDKIGVVWGEYEDEFERIELVE
ncbi:hypothetical protein [Bacillus sp. FJAT-22090]|uniref:hypothetical protein n=1 Tax=Bacillus sp. FJAT-22090 TaxID=1581038 RepID=UPI0011A3B706|nr:hypothetical protein [Bacillus sp. FJAT-22090]